MDKELPGQTTPGITVLEEALLWHKIYYGEGILALLCLAALSHTNYLPFHVCIEILVVAVAITLFSIGWNARHITRNNEFIQLAIAFLPIGLIDLLHTLSYNGMGVFPEFGRNMPTQLWISACGMQSAAYLCTEFYLDSKTKPVAWTGLCRRDSPEDAQRSESSSTATPCSWIE